MAHVKEKRSGNGNLVRNGVLVLDGRFFDITPDGCIYHSDGLSVAESSIIRNIRRFTHTVLREGLVSDWTLNLAGSGLRRLPVKLCVNGDCFLNSTKITELPAETYIKRSLIVNNTPLKRLPENLKIGGTLDISDTQVTALPKGLHIKGNLILLGTPITSISESVRIDGCIVCSPEQLRRLPARYHQSEIPALPNIRRRIEGLARHYINGRNQVAVCWTKTSPIVVNE